MDNKDLLKALSDLCAEKEIDRDVILDALDAALVAAYKKNFSSAQNVEVLMDRKTGVVRVMARKEVVEFVADSDSQTHISLREAQKINPAYEIGDTVDVEVTPRDFGRMAATTAKQVVTQRIREAERGIIYSEYSEKEDKLVTGTIESIDEKGNVHIDIGKLVAILPKSEQPETETYEMHKLLRCYVTSVREDKRGTLMLLSRKNQNLVKRLFEIEVPEIEQGVVEIKSISREAGSRTKIAVYSKDPDVDAQGACIGPKGMRVQAIGDELRNEKIDIVKWSEDPAEFISASLSPSKVVSVEVNEEEKSAKVTVPEHQLSLAIGKSGQNVRLAARLTGWKIDISAASEE